MLNSKYIKIFGLIVVLSVLAFFVIGYSLQKHLVDIYQARESLVIKDRHNQEIALLPNENGYWARYLDEVPPRFKELLIKKEDRAFYFHFGFNPWSLLQAGLRYIGIGNRKASSTISQQLVKVLLGKELERNIKNKIIEIFYTLSLETFKTKEEILIMYANSVYFGNQAQGIYEASRLYFNVSPEMLADGQILQLLATIHSPTTTNPSTFRNGENAPLLAGRLNLDAFRLTTTAPATVLKNMQNYTRYDDSYFELESLFGDSLNDKSLTCDIQLTQKIREILKRNIQALETKNVKNGAVIVIKLPENEILALVGSPDPRSFKQGYQINMLKKARPIGSTIKPFIYLYAFKKGLRPYTLVEDREYKYITAIGFPLYPKNFDYKYRGEVNLHYALANSLNVPSVKVLEYVGLEEFYSFLEKDLEFKPVQELNNYQLGIALGALEMSLYDLSWYFTIFANQGVLKELKIVSEIEERQKQVSESEYVQLVNKILTDRKTGIEQFGLVSELNLSQKNYALKTGTSRDFHDSWVIGYTPDFLVGVWLGNADNTAMDAVSGQTGAGRIWSEVMELMFWSEYNRKTPFDFDMLKEFWQENGLEYGLPGDDFKRSLNALKEKDSGLILIPHEGDVFLLEDQTRIILKSRKQVRWFINNEFLSEAKSTTFIPQKPGYHRIKAEGFEGEKEEISIYIHQEVY